jgi:cytochrome c553
MKPFYLAATALALVCAQAHAQDRNLGRNLAAQCANCHGPNGRSQGGIPGLAGQGRAYIIAQMSAFKAGQRSGPAATIMHQLAKGYTDEQIALMADYFSVQQPGK